MVEIISQDCLSMLPLSPEPIGIWNDNGDLFLFLTRLYEPGGYSSYGKYLFTESKTKWQGRALNFEEYAKQIKPAPDAESLVESVPALLWDRNLGLLAKYSTAWEAVDSAVLSESAFFSLAHILEGGTDLEASILLASNLYYRQALQMLRNYLEGMVLQLHFCNNQPDFTRWKAGMYRVPSLRGRDGLLKSLVDSGLMDRSSSQEASDLYGDLNGSIHGKEERLVNTGLFKGQWTGLVFKYDRFEEWCKYFSRSVDLGIRLLAQSTDHWLSTRPIDQIQCDVCHNQVDFAIDREESPGLVKFTCKKCGSSAHYSEEWALERGY
jgi:hypothetical protein